MEEAEEGKGRSYGVEGAMAPSLPLPQQRVDVQMRVLAREEISNGFPLGQVGSYPSALYGTTPRTGRHQGLQAVQESGRPPSLCQSRIHHRVHRHEIVLRVHWCSRWSFSHVWHRSGPSHRISRLNSRQRMEAIALLAPTSESIGYIKKKVKLISFMKSITYSND
jgi:hypothetical protein